MGKTTFVHPYLTLDFWTSHLEKLFGSPSRPPLIPVTGSTGEITLLPLCSYYDWGFFKIGFFQAGDRRRPTFYVFYENDYAFCYQLDFNDIDVFMEFLTAIKNPTRLPLCINFDPAKDMIQAALKDLC